MFDRQAMRTFALHPLQGSKLERYAVALLAMAAALGLRAAFQPVMGGSMHLVSISAATVFAAWYCGLWPAAVSTILGTLAANTLFIPPYGPFGPLTQRDLTGELLFFVFCAAIIAVGEGGRRAFLRVGQVREMLAVGYPRRFDLQKFPAIAGNRGKNGR